MTYSGAPLISELYRQEQQQLHGNPNYGVASIQFAPLVTEFLNQFGIRTLLDYGAGKGRLAKHIRPNHEIVMTFYDPAVPVWSNLPKPHQMVVCIDVLEHIEPDLLNNVLDHLAELTEKIGFFTVHTGPAIKVLSDGRNAHLIQKPPSWWLPKIFERFELITFQRTGAGFWVLVANRNALIS